MVPRLKVDLEGWKMIKEKEKSKQEEYLHKEAEDSLQEKDLKRKHCGNNRKHKRRRLELLKGLGSTIHPPGRRTSWAT